MKSAINLGSIEEVVEYWCACLKMLDAGESEQHVAGLMVNIVSNERDGEWSTGRKSHPAYPLIFELAASLELPPEMTAQRLERWACIRVLLGVLRGSVQPAAPTKRKLRPA